MKQLLIAFLTLPLAAWLIASTAASRVQGLVTAMSDGKPVAGATITVRHESGSTITDSAGRFSIAFINTRATLLCSAPGFQTASVTVHAGQTNVAITLRPASVALDEVVVVGLGIASDEDAKAMESAAAAPRASGLGIRKSAGSQTADFNTEEYASLAENSFLDVLQNPLSTFSIDVDGASYANVRRFLRQGELPPAGAVRVEEMINYFHYDYPAPSNNDPFSINTEMAACPWNRHHQLVMVGLQGKQIPTEHLPAANLVFLVDVSGSMMDENKLPLVKSSLRLLVDQLRATDHVALVVYAGNAGLVLPPTSGTNKTAILDAINGLEAGGSTAGGEGIRLAYDVAKRNFVKNGNNRVILCTDGDFNVGASSDAELVHLIEWERKSGVYLTVLGYGMGNYKDSKMELLADKGNGNHEYIDNISEARKVLVSEFGGTLFTIAKDVKLQVEFNPAKVQAYRLVGYENRLLNKEDFNDDKKDAGDLGSGHTVTALYELIPVGEKNEFKGSVDPLKYQQPSHTSSANSNEWMTIRFRYKQPDADNSRLITHVVNAAEATPSTNFRFVTAVAEFGMLLNHSAFIQHASLPDVLELAQPGLGSDREGYRHEFIELVGKAGELMEERSVSVRER